MKKDLVKLALTGSLLLAGGFYNLNNSEGNSYKNNTEFYKRNSNENISQGNSFLWRTPQAKKLIPEKEIMEKPKIDYYLSQRELDKYILQVMRKVRVNEEFNDKKLIRYVALRESSGNPNIKSHAGAEGLMQLMPKTYVSITKDSSMAYINDPEKNMEAGIKYLNYLSRYCERNHPGWDNLDINEKREVILSSYNIGHGKVRDKFEWDLNKIYKRYPGTKQYVNDILKNYEKSKGANGSS